MVALLVVLSSAAFAQPLPPVDELPSIAELNDPFRMMDGTLITTPEEWVAKRRPELKRLFSHYMYGYTPEPPTIVVSNEAEDTLVLGGKARLVQRVIRFSGHDSPDAPAIHLALIVPEREGGPWPVFLAINKCGNYTILSDSAIVINESAWQQKSCPPQTDEGRGTRTDFWSIEYLIERGYAFATFHESDIDPDKNDFSDGVHAQFTDLPGPPEARWGTIAAWAWGLQRCVDFLTTESSIDAKGICVTGHSRRGKTALLAGAFDERIAITVPHQSGTGGCALSRDNDQETIERINRVFPHWFNDLFTQFDDREELLPFDQHLLMALVAPRPLLNTGGMEDTWANYESAYRAQQAADKVYKFLGARGIGGTGLVAPGESILGPNFGDLVQYRREGGHTLNEGYWEGILDFADAHLRP